MNEVCLRKVKLPAWVWAWTMGLPWTLCVCDGCPQGAGCRDRPPTRQGSVQCKYRSRMAQHCMDLRDHPGLPAPSMCYSALLLALGLLPAPLEVMHAEAPPGDFRGRSGRRGLPRLLRFHCPELSRASSVTPREAWGSHHTGMSREER